QNPCPCPHVFDIENAPLPIQALPVGAAESGTASVVHIGNREPATRPELDLQVEGGARRSRGPPMADQNERRTLALGGRQTGVARWIVERVGRVAIRRGE